MSEYEEYLKDQVSAASREELILALSRLAGALLTERQEAKKFTESVTRNVYGVWTRDDDQLYMIFATRELADAYAKKSGLMWPKVQEMVVFAELPMGL